MEQAQQKAAMTLREQCEQVVKEMVQAMTLAARAGLPRHEVAIVTTRMAEDILERFAKQQQAVGLREAKRLYNEWPIDRAIHGFPNACEQRAREREGG